MFNFPEPRPRSEAQAPDPAAPSGRVEPGFSERSNPWEDAARRLIAHDAAAEPKQQPPERPPAPWAVPAPEKSGKVFAQKFGRGALWVVIGLATVTGIRTWISPPDHGTPAPAPAKTGPSYPTDQAQAVAARWARAYLTWDEARAADRARLLAADMPSGTDTAIGWDGHGQQEVLDVQPGAVTVADRERARVRVEVLLHGAKADEKKGIKETPDHWVGLDVPVVATRGRIVVTGQPGTVGIPASAPALPDLPVPETDQDLSTATQSVTEKFFHAYATGETDTVAAPGKTIPPLPAGMALKGVSSWALDKGSGDHRTGTARITWETAGGVVEQTYRVELTRVSSADAQRWQVSDVHGGTA
ncbi:conjugal transfer protein [Streptomyces klenkii]|uniref:conjugal transfer protein n=1 Tax=Streptomyces klenkii TaxID=1420899 RepID=UPI0034446CA6